MNSIYKFEKLSFGFTPDHLLFDKVDLTINTNDITLLSGFNGSGKTSFCRILTGLIKDYSGSVTLYDKDLKDHSVIEISSKTIFIKQEPRANVILSTPDEDLKLWQTKFNRKDSDAYKEQRIVALKSTAMEDFADTPLWELSNGQLKRIGLASLDLNPGKFWILDEPLTGLDQKLIDKFIKILMKRKQSGKGALIVSHRINHYKNIIDRTLIIDKKKIMEDK